MRSTSSKRRAKASSASFLRRWMSAVGDHVLLVQFEQVADVLLRGGADAGHGLFGGGVDLAAQRVDLVGDVLLRRGLQRILQRLVEHDALLGVDGQLVDQRVLRRDLVVERIDEGLEHRGVAFQRLALGQQLLLLGLLLVVFGGELRALALELGAVLLVWSRRRSGFRCRAAAG